MACDMTGHSHLVLWCGRASIGGGDSGKLVRAVILCKNSGNSLVKSCECRKIGI